MVSITDAAKSYFIAVMNSQGKRCLTLVYKEDRCNGVSFDYEFKMGSPGSIRWEWEIDEDTFYEFFIDTPAVPYLLGGIIDFVTEQFSSRITYDLPHAQGVCGCGKSFNF